MANKFTQKAQNTLNRSLDIAKELGHTYIGSEHILLALISEEDSIAAKILASRGARVEKLRKSIIDIAGTGSESSVTSDDLTPRARKIIEASAFESQKNATKFIGTEHLLMALLCERDCIAVRLLEAEGIPASELKSDLAAYLTTAEKSYTVLSKKETDEKSKAKESSVLLQHSRNLTDLAKTKRIDPVIGRSAETDRVIRILARRTKNNPCLIGEPGVGKTAIVEGLALRIAAGNIPDALANKKIMMLDLPSMIAGAKYRGEFEERLKSVMREAVKNPDIILFIDEIHTVVGAGAAEGAVDAANIIKPALARSELQIIGATTISEYKTHIEKDAALERRFCPVTVEEPCEDEAYEILLGIREKYERHHGLRFTDEALKNAVTLSARYMPDRFLPDKAIDLIDEAASKKRINASLPSPEIKKLEKKLTSIEKEKEDAICSQKFEIAAKLRDRELRLKSKLSQLKSDLEDCRNASLVNSEDIAKIITEQTGIPIRSLLEDEGRKLCDLEKKLEKDIIGQSDAIRAVCTAVRRGRVGLKPRNSPIGSFLFLGKTGVGKTALATALATSLFDSPHSLIRFDMSEYMEKHSVSKLIGSPPGYVGYGEGGQLTEKVRRHPYSVVLFDEIEKAHHDIFHLLLQVLEDGALTDSSGRRVDFSNTIVIMTSNVGSDDIQKKIMGFSSEGSMGVANEEKIMTSLKETFKPEFLNRIDDLVIFRSLSIEDITKIADRMLADVVKRASDIGISLTPDAKLSRFFAEKSFNEAYGARPLRRMIIKKLEDTLSTQLLEKNILTGDSVLAYVEPNDDSVKLCKI